MGIWRIHRTMILAVGLLLAGGACHDGAGPTAAGGGPTGKPPDGGGPPDPTPVTLDVLFIGNSLTYINDLPASLAAIAGSAHDVIRVEMVAGPKLSLMDQLVAGGEAESAIRRGGWGYVVLQQGASADSDSRDTLILATETFDTMIRSVGARTALYMPWPPASAPGEFDASRESYQAAAAAVNGLFLPVGVAWQVAWHFDGGLALYEPDGVHPSALGTYLAAITIYEKLTGHDAERLPSTAIVNGVNLGLSEPTVRLLQHAAHLADLAY